MKFKPLLFALLLFSIFYSSQINVTFYHAVGCHFCAQAESDLNELSKEYDLNIIKKDINDPKSNLDEFFSNYDYYGVSRLDAGTPTTLVNGKVLVVGAITPEKWRSIFDDCNDETGCIRGSYLKDVFSPIPDHSAQEQLTLAVLIGAAIVDSINPCTIAVMVMLLGVILITEGQGKALLAGLAFSFTVFIMYLVMGFGVLHAITNTGLTNIFYIVVTAMALILTVMEINAYFRYKPGFFAVEMPTFLRSYLKTAMKKATTLPGVVAVAVLCSLFLLPCSSGPYLLVLGMLAKAVTVQTLLYLIIYNFVFIIPMLIITIVIHKGMVEVDQIKDLKDKYVREIHLVSGIILFLLFLLMLNQLFRFI